jgi:hypothetical protein
MKFNMLTESEMIQKTKAGHGAYLDLLLSKYEPFLLQHLSKSTANKNELLTLRNVCIQYVRTNFFEKFSEQKHVDFATFLLGSVDEACYFDVTL